MLSVLSIGEKIAARRKQLRLTQAELARRASVGHSTLDALENGRLGELGLNRIIRILSVLGLEMNIQQAVAHRPTYEELLEENRKEQLLGCKR